MPKNRSVICLYIPLFVAALVFSTGCASSRGFDADRMWRHGYGYNNPNSERFRQGLDPVNFDGRTPEESNHNFAEQLIGGLIGGIGRGIANSLSR